MKYFVLFTQVTFWELLLLCNGVTFWPVTCTCYKVLKSVTFNSTEYNDHNVTTTVLLQIHNYYYNIIVIITSISPAACCRQWKVSKRRSSQPTVISLYQNSYSGTVRVARTPTSVCHALHTTTTTTITTTTSIIHYSITLSFKTQNLPVS